MMDRGEQVIREFFASEEDYWVVAKINEHLDGCDMRRGKDDILFIALPQFKVKRPSNVEDMTVGDYNRIRETYIDSNIFLSGFYPPFQRYQRLDSFWKCFPITSDIDIRLFLSKALLLGSNEINDYKELLKKCNKESSDD